MPLIDIHVHSAPARLWNPWVNEYFEISNPEFLRRYYDELTPQEFNDFLGYEKVDYAICLAEYAPKATGVVTNEFLSDFCRDFDRLVPFGSICLYEGPPPEIQVENCVKNLGCRGLKLLPSYQHFYPDDPRLKPAYETAQSLKIPVMFHTGTSIFKGTRVKYADPLLLDDIADDFPDLTIIMCHGGRPFWYGQAEWMLRRHKNVFIDLSGVPLKKIPQVFPHIEQLPHKFLFGTDWPTFPSISRQADVIRGMNLSEEVKEGILWKNAARILGLEFK